MGTEDLSSQRSHRGRRDLSDHTNEDKKMSDAKFFAHTPGPNGDWHDLIEHLIEVAQRAREFASGFSGGQIAYLAGLLHDLGKISPAFQKYLKAQAEGTPCPSTPHSPWGAALAYNMLKSKNFWREVVLPIAGHHAGLQEPGDLSARLVKYVRKEPDFMKKLQQFAVDLMKQCSEAPKIPLELRTDLKKELWIRMIFSALVDADRLDTEDHVDPHKTGIRQESPTINELWYKFGKKHEKKFMHKAESKMVNRIRQAVYNACLEAADGPTGVYRLTVPTGGGKTLSGLAFCLRHALKNGLRRIITAIPYTSIIDQTAQVYRDFLGEDAVLEHHSQVNDHKNTALSESQDNQSLRLRLAAENWDFPVIVTTTVQLFESLFSNKPGRCRKLHNLAHSVILLDEVQTMPPELLRPTVDVLRTLVEDYGVTVVLCTATQPAWENTPYLKEFQVEVPEIVPDYLRHFEALRRVDYEMRPAPMSFADLAGEIQDQTQIMVILNTRKDAVRLFLELNQPQDAYHLSTLLCGAHRKHILAEVKDRLEAKEPVRLISTQVVEAGVDLDFPVVYRAIGPLDRIVQAAGRCNREGGKLTGKGKMVIMELAEGKAPKGPYKEGLRIAQLLLKLNPPEALHSPELYQDYFRRLFQVVELDKKGIQELRKVLDFPKVTKEYRLIPKLTSPVLVPYGESGRHLLAWKAHSSRETWRRLQPYLVNLYDWEVQKFKEDEWLEEITPGIFLWKGGYDKRLGLVGAYYDPCDLVW
ncbi:MAG: CRISPR-associated helicase Cas3' [Desulfobaccales bacterium]|jgi:CRISPR-associated endonuclease/helicase Cas3